MCYSEAHNVWGSHPLTGCDHCIDTISRLEKNNMLKKYYYSATMVQVDCFLSITQSNKLELAAAAVLHRVMLFRAG